MTYIGRKRKRDSADQAMGDCQSNKRRKMIGIPIIKLKSGSWDTIESSMLLLLGKADIEVDLKTWLKPIMDSYINTCSLRINSEELTIYINGDGSIMHKFIPKVRANEFHLLPSTSQKRLELAYIDKTHPLKCQSFFAQFAFRLLHLDDAPFTVVLEVLSTHHKYFLDVIKINGVEIYLDEVSIRGGFKIPKYYMGNGQSNKYYSYLPMFKKLFLNQQQEFLQHLTVEFKFERPKKSQQ